MDSDRVLVMDAGAAVEFDHPHNLLMNKDGHLYDMVETTERDTADSLRDVAAAVRMFARPACIVNRSPTNRNVRRFYRATPERRAGHAVGESRPSNWSANERTRTATETAGRRRQSLCTRVVDERLKRRARFRTSRIYFTVN